MRMMPCLDPLILLVLILELGITMASDDVVLSATRRRNSRERNPKKESYPNVE